MPPATAWPANFVIESKSYKSSSAPRIIMKVPARNIPVASRPKDLATSGRWLTTKKVIDIEIHIPIPPHLGVTLVCVSRVLR